MSTGYSQDLWDALGITVPAEVDDASGLSPPHDYGADWDISSVDGLTEVTSGPYCAGDTITVEMQFSGAGRSFQGIRDRNANYSVNKSQNCSLANQAGDTFDFTISSTAAGTTNNTIGITFNNAWNTASGVGTEQTLTFDVGQYAVTIDTTSYDSTNDNVDVTYTIEPCGEPDYEVELYRDNDGTPTLAASETRTSSGQYTITDTNPNSNDLSDEYRIDVTDNSGAGTEVQDTATQSFPH